MAPPMPRGNRFTSEYQVNEEDVDSIIQIVAYHRKEYDLSSLFNFRQTNLRSRQVVDSIRQYQRMVLHGLTLLCALLRTRLAMRISLPDFYDQLCAKACSICGSFAGLISILAWKRCCFKCIGVSAETQVRSLASVPKHLHPTRSELGQLRSFKTLPGIYRMNETPLKSRVAPVSLYQATLACRQESRTLAEMEWVCFNRGPKFNFMAAQKPNDIIGTRNDNWLNDAQDKVYSEDGFLNQFRWCGQAQLLRESSDGGKRQPP
ncbi:hypothetical protein BDV12DRAFT_189491 [Aspergillus spectabilis]